MSTPHSGAPPGQDVERAALGQEAARGSAVAGGGGNSTTPQRNTQARTLPASAAKLLEMRYRGRVPCGSIFITAHPILGKHWPWRIIVDDDPERLDFSVCAGLSVIVGALDQSRMDTIAQAVGRFKPKRVIAVDYSTGRIMFIPTR